VEAAIARPRRLLAPVVALVAMGVLAAMVVTGRSPENKQLVRASGAGVMTQTPVEIDRVELQTKTTRWTFIRGRDGWTTGAGGRAVPASLAVHLDDSITFMHVSAPVRVMDRTEWAPVGLREFGLDPPDYTARLYHRDTRVIGAEFGAPNPQKVLQYMKLQDRDELYLMSRFVGQEWEQALREASAQ